MCLYCISIIIHHLINNILSASKINLIIKYLCVGARDSTAITIMIFYQNTITIMATPSLSGYFQSEGEVPWSRQEIHKVVLPLFSLCYMLLAAGNRTKEGIAANYVESIVSYINLFITGSYCEF